MLNKRIQLPSAEYLKQWFMYDHETGDLIWIRENRRNRDGQLELFPSANQKKIAGCLDKDGYVVVRLDGIGYQAHRIIYKMIHNEEPYRIDHRDNNNSNNRAGNLIPKTRISKERPDVRVKSTEYNHNQYKILRNTKKTS